LYVVWTALRLRGLVIACLGHEWPPMCFNSVILYGVDVSKFQAFSFLSTKYVTLRRKTGASPEHTHSIYKSI